MLVGILIICVLLQYFYKPMAAEYDEVSSEIEELNDEYQEKSLSAAAFDIYEEQYNILTEKIVASTENLLPLTTNDEIDKIVTKMVISSGLTVDSLLISELQSFRVETREKPVDKNGKVIKDEDDIVTVYNTGVYYCDMSYSLSGRYSGLLSAIDFISQNKSLCIKSVNFENTDEISSDPNCEIQLTITFFMYDENTKVGTPETEEAETTAEEE